MSYKGFDSREIAYEFRAPGSLPSRLPPGWKSSLRSRREPRAGALAEFARRHFHQRPASPRPFSAITSRAFAIPPLDGKLPTLVPSGCTVLGPHPWFPRRDRAFDEKPEFRHYDDRFNAWAIDIASQDSGVSIPPEGIDRTTAFQTRVNERDMLMLSVRGVSAAAYVRTRWGMDAVVVLVNAERHRGVAFGPLVTVPNSLRRAHTFAHELGHALFGLADEYTEASACNFGYRLWNRTRPNVDNKSDRRRIKWIADRDSDRDGSRSDLSS